MAGRGWGCPMPDMACPSGLAAGHSCTLQPHWWHLWENVFKKGKKNATQAEKEGTKGARNSPANTRVRKEGSRGGAPVTRADIPLEQMFPCRPWKIWKRPWWNRYFPTPHGRDYGTSRNFPAACRQDWVGAGGYCLKEPQPMESVCWHRFS